MKNLLAKVSAIIVAAFLVLGTVNVSAQIREVRTSAGTEFIFSFMPNIGSLSKLTLFISSEHAASGVIELPRLGSTIAFTVQPNVVTAINIPNSMGALPKGIKSSYGIRVSSDLPITVYGLNQEQNTTDAFLALPTHALGKEYMAAAYKSYSTSYPSFIAIVGTQDNTQVKVTSRAATTYGPAGLQQVFTLNKLETFLIASNGNDADISGSRIESDKPIAITSGGQCLNIPTGFGACDHIVEMMPPVNAWGSSFITYPLARRTKGDLIRVMASTDNTEVKINGTQVATLAKGTYYDSIRTTSNVIETTKPALVTQYSLGQAYDRVVSDPFMMLVPPTEQFLDNYTFSTPASGFAFHFANVVIRTSALSSLYLDGVVADQSLFKPIGDGSFSGGQIPIVPGSHSIVGDVPFGLYVYGFGDYDSYGYPGGMSTEIINPINGDYKNVRVTSRLQTSNVDLDVSSFVVAPQKIEHSEGVTSIEWFFPEFSIGQIKNLDYEVVAKNLLPGEQRVITTSLDLTYQDLNGKEHKRSLGQQELTVLSSGFTIGVGTDKATYGPNQEVRISTQVANAGNVNGLVSVVVEIYDVNGNYVSGVNSPPAFVLGAKDSIALSPQVLSTGNIYSGDYQVRALLKNQEGAVVAEASASFAIVDADASHLSAQVATDKLVYTPKDTLNVSNQLTNLSENSFVENVSISTRVLKENGDVFWSSSETLTQLTPQALETRNHTVSLANAEPGTYVVQLTVVNSDGQVQASHQANFQVQDNLLFSLNGSVLTASSELLLGESPSCTFTIRNVGTKLIPAQSIKLNMVRVDTELTLLSLDKSVDLAVQEEKSFAPELPAPQDKGDYACVLEAVIAGQATVLATALITIKESPIKLDGDIALGDKSRLLVLMDDSSTEKPYLENLLTQADWFYTIVTSANDFDAQLKAGGYGAYALLSEKITLAPQTRDLLKAQVALGDGLFVANGHDRRHQSLEDVLGVRVHAKQAQIKGVSVDAGVLGDAWSHTFDEAFNSMTFDAQGATVVGRYVLPSSQGNNSQQSFGAASGFNVFVLENFTSLSSTVEGRIAVGGNLSLQNFSVGDKLDASKLHDVAIVGGKVTFPSGRIYYGNLLAGGSVTGVGDAVRYGMAPGAVIRGNAPVSVDFASERDYLQTLSADTAALPANGTVKMQWGGLELKGDCSSAQQVFTVNANDLATAHTFAVSCIPSGATVIFNIPGQSATIQSIGMQSLSNLREKVLFNFPQAKTLTFKSVAIEGSVLAPYAVVEQPAGRVEGQVIAKSWNSTNWGYMSIHNRSFKGDLSALTKPKSTNAIAVYQYQQGKTVFASFDVLAQALTLHSKPVAADANVFAQLLLAALNQINPEPANARAGKVVPVVVAFANTGNQTAAGQALLVLSPNLVMVQSAEFSLVPQTTTWSAPFNLPATEQASKTLYVRLPASGSAAIQLQLQTSPDGTVRFEKALSLTAH